jgi:hypothetical protein
MQWLVVILILSLAFGLRRQAGCGTHGLMLLVVAVVVGAWYLQL